ncbi:TPA: hypothetical protein DCZ79_01085 [Candidatus Nomurabacteria bacterium]|nr:hypothetical protein [Candidatus Nomurabacteria bacterium]
MRDKKDRFASWQSGQLMTWGHILGQSKSAPPLIIKEDNSILVGLLLLHFPQYFGQPSSK